MSRRKMDPRQYISTRRNAKGGYSSNSFNITDGHPPPSVGILSRTLVHSPVVLWVFPARVRNRGRKDVVFIRERSIEFKELVSARQLLDIGLKMEFDGKIKAARIMGTLHQERSSLHSKGYSPMLSEWETNIEHSNTRFETPEQAGAQRTLLPPHIVLLILESNARQYLVMVFSYTDNHNETQLATYLKPLPGSRQYIQLLGTHLAVDPRGRAIAIGAQAGSVWICLLKARDQLESDVDRHGHLIPDQFQPVKEERLLAVNGIILHMDFLCSPKCDAGSNIVLLVIISVSGITFARFYEFESSKSLREIRETTRVFQLRKEETVPLLLIPLDTSPGFILIGERRMMIYRDVLSDGFDVQALSYAAIIEKSETYGDTSVPDNPPGVPLWTAWTKPVRTGDYTHGEDVFYLAGADGTVICLKVSTEAAHAVAQLTCKLDININTGFSCLDVSGWNGSLDLFIAAGNMGDGCLFEAGNPLNTKVHSQPLRNFSPIIDFTVVPSTPPSLQRGHGVPMPSEERIFACAGTGTAHGVLCEIKYGVEAYLPMPDIALPAGVGGTFTGIWLLPGQSTGAELEVASLVLSYPDSSDLVTLDARHAVGLNNADPFMEALIDCDSETVCAAVTADGIAIQITKQAIRTVSVSERDRSDPNLFEFPVIAPKEISHASIDGRNSAYLISLSSSSGMFLQFGKFIVIDEEVKMVSPESRGQLKLSHNPSCLLLHVSPRGHIAFVGTLDGKLLAYLANGQGLFPVYEHTFDGNTSICESMCLISVAGDNYALKQSLLLCGLRNGTLHVLEVFEDSQGGLSLKQRETRTVGMITVSVMPDYASHSDTEPFPSRAIVSCHGVLYRLTYSSADALRARLQRIYNEDTPTLRFPLPLAAVVIPCEPWNFDYSVFSKSFLIVYEERISVISLDSTASSGAMPSRIYVGGTPSRVIYSQHKDRLVVAFTHIDVNQLFTQDDGPYEQRLQWPMIKIICPSEFAMSSSSQHSHLGSLVKDRSSHSPKIKNDPHIERHNPPGKNTVIVGRSSDIVTGMLEWIPILNGKSWPLIVIHTSKPQSKGTHKSGRILIYRLSTNESGNDSAELKKTITRNFAVYSMAAFGDDRLIYGCGNYLEIIKIDEVDGLIRWSDGVRLLVHSPARTISTTADEIFVTTTNHSHLVCVLEDGELIPKFHDVRARRGINHLFLSEESIIIGCSKDGIFCGLWKPPMRIEDECLTPLFEGKLSGSMTRIHQARVSASWLRQAPKEKALLLGSTMSGSFHAFELLGLPLWRLFRFVQNMITRNHLLSPMSYRQFHNSPIEPSEGELTDMYVDGDILSRLLRGSLARARALLREMISDECTPEFASSLDYQAAAKRRERLSELVAAAFPEAKDQDPVNTIVAELSKLLITRT